MRTSAADPSVPPSSPGPPVRRGRRGWWIVGACAVAAIAFVLVVFQPQRLVIDDVVDADLPGLVASAEVDDTPPTTSDAPEPAAPTSDPLSAAAAEAMRRGAPVAVTTGAFESRDHPTSGTALLVAQPDGTFVVRFEGLDTDNGPDLRVVLSPAAVGSGEYGSLTELAPLKGNVGSQNYAVPDVVALADVRSVVIWCDRFSVAFGEAPLGVAA